MIVDAWGKFKNDGELIKYARKRKGISQKELATAVGISRTAISRLENHNIKPDFNIMAMIHGYLGLPHNCIFQSPYNRDVLCNYTVGKSKLCVEDRVNFIGAMYVLTEFDIDSITNICITDGDEKYLVELTDDIRGEYILCTDSDDICTLVKAEDFDSTKYRAVGIILENITDRAFPVFA